MGRAVGAGRPGLAHRVRGDVARSPRRRVRPPRRRPGPRLSAPRERAGPGRRRGPALRPALGAQRLGGGRGHQDVQVARQLHLAHRPARRRRPGLSPPGVAGALPLADRGDRGTIADAEKALERLDARGPALRDRRPAGARATAATWSRRATARDADPDALATFHAAHGRRHGHPGRAGRHLRAGERGALERRRRGRGRGASRWRQDAPRCSPPRWGCRCVRRRPRWTRRPPRLVAERDEARRARDFARADALRDELVALGWTVEDTAVGDRHPPLTSARNPWSTPVSAVMDRCRSVGYYVVTKEPRGRRASVGN